jgi:hypothetical protein
MSDENDECEIAMSNDREAIEINVREEMDISRNEC